MFITTSMALFFVEARGATWESEPQPVVFSDTIDVFSSVAFDTGYWPGAGDPIAIRFFLTPTGGVHTELFGASALQWPALSHQVIGETGGRFGIDSEIAVGAEIKLDLFGVFTGVVPLITEYVSFEDEVPVEGLLLAGGANGSSAAVSVDDPNAIPPLQYAFPVIPGVDLVGAVQIRPDIAADMAGVSVNTAIGDEELIQVAEDGSWLPLPPDPTRPSELGMVTTWNGHLAAVLSLVIEPEIRVDTFLGAFTLASFPIPVSLVDVDEYRTSTPVFTVHPLPVMEDVDPGYDFGVVAVGDVTNLEVPFDNIGALLLQGTLRIEGDPSFTVWPDTLAAIPAGGTGFVVTYAPTAAGEHGADLVIDTNDPTRATLRIPLVGGAEGSTDVVPPAGEDEAETPIGFCGCANTGPGTSMATVFGLLLVLRSRRLPGGVSRTSGSPRRR